MAARSALVALWRSRWLVLVASFWIQACSGIGYAFGSYSPLLKSTLSYSQQQINFLGNAKDIGDSLGLLSGSLCEVLPTWGIYAIGALQNLGGYGWLWLIVTGRASVMPFWVICTLIFVGTNGETYFNTASLVTNVGNFPKSQGQVVGLMKGFTGLCGAIFTQVYTTFFAPSEAAYLFIVAVGPTMVACFVMLIVRPLKAKAGDSSRSESIGFTFIYSNCLLLAAYLMGVLIVQDTVTLTFTTNFILTAVLFLLMVLPLVTPLVSWVVLNKSPLSDRWPPTTRPLNIEETKEIQAPFLQGNQQSNLGEANFPDRDVDQEPWSTTNSRAGSFTGSVDNSDLEGEKPTDIDSEAIRKKKIDETRRRLLHAAAEGAVQVKSRKGPRRGENFTLLQGLVKADFWLLFWGLVCGAGTGLTAIDNMGQMSESQGYESSKIFVSLISIWNFLGRLLGGYASEVIARSYALPRSWALVFVLAFMAVGHFLFAMAWPGTLYAGTFLVGIGYGAHYGIVPPIVSELFGLRHFGVFYNFYIMANPTGSIFLSGFLAGYLYDLEAAKQQTIRLLPQTSGHLHPTAFHSSEETTCYGAVCFRLTFLIMTAVCIVGMILTTILSMRTRVVYKTLYGQKQQEQPQNDRAIH